MGQDGTVINVTSHPSAGLPVTAYPPHTILAGVVGSQAYGLAHAGSDVDTVGVFICDTHELLGIDGARAAETTLVSHHPDAQFHEIGKFMQLALKGSPGAIELLSLPSHTQLLPAGATLVDMRPRLLSTDTVYRSYRGYGVTHQRRLADGSEEVDPDSAAYRKRAKTARHCVRALVQGAQLLRTGALTVSMTDHLDLLQAAERDVNSNVGWQLLRVRGCFWVVLSVPVPILRSWQ